MRQLYKILNLVFKFDLRDNPNGGIYSLLEVAYLKLIQDDGTPLTEGGHIAARRLSRSFPIMCVMSFWKVVVQRIFTQACVINSLKLWEKVSWVN